MRGQTNIKKNRVHFKKNYSVRSIYLTISILILGVTLLISSITYIKFKKIGTELITNYNKESLNHISTTAKTIDLAGRKLALEVFQDKDIIPLFSLEKPKFNELSLALKRLDSYRVASNYIHSIYVYNNKTDLFYTTVASEEVKSKENFFDQDLINFIDKKIKYDLSYPIPRKIERKVLGSKEIQFEDVYTFIYHENVNLPNRPIEQLVVVNISQNWLRELISSMDERFIDDTFIINGKGKIISSNINQEDISDGNYETGIQGILKEEKKNGFMIKRIDGVEKLITYVSVPELNEWKFIRINNYDTITQPLKDIRNSIMSVVIMIVVIGNAFAYLASKQLYKPVKKLQDTLSNLKKQQIGSSYLAKQGILKDLIKGKKVYDKSSLEENLIQYKIPLDTSMLSQMILLKIDDYANFIQNHSKSSQNIMRYTISNIGEEIGTEKIKCCIADLMEDTLVAIINFESELAEEDLEFYIEDYIINLQYKVYKICNISLSAIISDKIEDVSLFPEIYKETDDASRYTIFYGNQAIISASVINEIERKNYIYPDQQHNLLFVNLRAGKLDTVKELYEEIMDDAIGYSYTAYMSTVLHLAYCVNLMIDSLNISEDESMVHEPNAFIKKVSEANSSEEIDKLFINTFEIISSFIQRMASKKKDNDYNKLIENIYHIIESNYMNIDTCIQTIADELGMSPPYLGRIFTKYTQKTITQCLSQVRIEKASELLVNTDQPISDISDQCGFSNITYFYKIFKKVHNITPSMYRSIHQNNK